MSAILRRRPKFASILSASYRNGPTQNVQMPELPKQLEGKFVKGQMYKYQDSLPKLPVPPLEQTLKKYITGVKVRLASQQVTIAWQIEGGMYTFGHAGKLLISKFYTDEILEILPPESLYMELHPQFCMWKQNE